MPFDASQLWWPPQQRLYDDLEALRLEAATVMPDAVQKSLADHSGWLTQLVSRFRPPSSASRQSLETESSLAVGAKKIIVEAPLRKLAFQVSAALVLDEVQSYILVKRWWGSSGGGSEAVANALRGGGVPDCVEPVQLRQIAALYYKERLYLLKAVGVLLRLGEDTQQGMQLKDAVEQSLATLLDGGLDGRACDCLLANLRGDVDLAGAGATGVAGAATSSGVPVMQSGGSMLLRAMAAEQLLLERCALLDILILIYYFPRKVCSAERFLSLARGFHEHLFSGTGAAPRDVSERSEHAAHAVQLGIVLLAEVLDTDSLLQCLAEGGQLSAEVSIFADQAVCQQVDKEFRSWWDAPTSSDAMVLLAWGTALCLINALQQGKGVLDAHAHAQVASANGAMVQLSALMPPKSAGAPPGAIDSPATRGVVRAILLGLTSSLLAAFDLSPAALGMPQTMALIDCLAVLYDGQPDWCQQFWEGNQAVDGPLRHLLGACRDLFPAVPGPLLALLGVLSEGKEAARCANAYLAALPAIASFQHPEDEGMQEEEEGIGDEQEQEEEGQAESTGQPAGQRQKQQRIMAGQLAGGGRIVRSLELLPLNSAPLLSVPQGISGRVVPLPAGTPLQMGQVPGDALVLWRVTCPEGVGQWVLMARVLHALQQLRQLLDAAAPAPSAQQQQRHLQVTSPLLAELGWAARFLARLVGSDPEIALELMQAEVPVEGAPKGFDLLDFVAQAAALACRVPRPDAALLADLLRLAHGVVPAMPVGAAAAAFSTPLLALHGVGGGGSAFAAAAAGMGASRHMPSLMQQLQREVESPTGCYPTTLQLLGLLRALARSGAAGAIREYLPFVLYGVLAQHASWRYASRSTRWRLATVCLELLRDAVVAPPLPPSSSVSGSAATEALPLLDTLLSLLAVEGTVDACLGAALPPPAPELEAMVGTDMLEVPAVEDAVEAWLRLVADLLPAAAADPRRGAAVLSALTTVDPATNLSAIGVLGSYIAYPYFDAATRALAVRAVRAALQAQQAAGHADGAGLLLQTADGQLSSAVRAALLEPFHAACAAEHPGLFAEAAQLLACALTASPSLADAMLFPCGLADDASKALPSASAANTQQQQQQQPASAGAGGRQLSKKRGGGGPWSALDGLYEMATQAERLWKEQPFVLAQALGAVSAIWQAGGLALKPLELLRARGEALWSPLRACVAAAASAAPEPSALAAAGDGSADAAAVASPPLQLSREEEEAELHAFRITAESHVLQVLALERYAALRSNDSGGAAHVSAVVLWGSSAASCTSRLLALLGRYGVSGAASMWRAELSSLARQAALQLTVAALSEEDRRALLLGHPLSFSLCMAAQQAAEDYHGAAAAASELQHVAVLLEEQPAASSASYLKLLPPSLRQALDRIAEDVLVACLPPAWSLPLRPLGAQLYYDPSGFTGLVGPVVMRHLPTLRQLRDALGTASAAVCTADGQLAALRGLRALLVSRGPAAGTASAAASQQLAVEPELVDGVAARVAAAVAECAASAVRTLAGGAAAGAALDVGYYDQAGLSGAREAAQLLQSLLMRWVCRRAGGRPDSAHAAALCAGMADTARVWLTNQQRQQQHESSAADFASHDAQQLSECLLASLLLLLQSLPADVENARLERRLLQLLPVLASTVSSQRPLRSLALNALAAAISRGLPLADWLPIVQSQLNLAALLAEAVPAGGGAAGPAAVAMDTDATSVPSPLESAAAEGEALLSLCSLMAQHTRGVQALQEEGVAAAAVPLARTLLHGYVSGYPGLLVRQAAPQASGMAQGSKAGAAPTRSASKADVAAAAASTATDYSGAYLAGSLEPSPVHRLWLALLGVVAGLVRSAGDQHDVARLTVGFVVAAEERLLLAVEPPAGTPDQPLTLAMVQEAELALFLLGGCGPLLGTWLHAAPGSPAAVRRAAVELLEFAGLPSSNPQYSPAVWPLSRSERDMASERWHVNLQEGWFRCVNLGVQQSSKAGQEQQQQQRGRDPPPCSAYSAAIAAGMYRCIAGALTLLCSLSPEVSEDEARTLGREFPTPDLLRLLQGQADAVAIGMVGIPGKLDSWSRHLCSMLLCGVHGAVALQEAMGVPPQQQQSAAIRATVTTLHSVLETGG